MGRGARLWCRRALIGTAVVGTAAALFDVTNYNVLSRSIRTLYGGARIAYVYKFTDPQTVEEIEALHQYAANVILETCLANEGLYIKMGQGLSAMSHVLPPEYTTTLRVLLDQAPPVSIADIKTVFESSTGAKQWEDVFVSFDEKAVASASIAQVHKATVRDERTGEVVPVAVKVQKPKIQHQIWWDLQCYFLVCEVLEYLFEIPMKWSAQTIGDNLLREVDFRIEVENCERARSHLGGHPAVYIPKVFPELCSKQLMVTEWIDATKLVSVRDVKAQFNTAQVLSPIFDFFADMIFRDGFVHCDPHPANLMVRMDKATKKPQVIVLDFGLCISESEEFRLAYGLLFKAMFTHDTPLLREIVASWGISNPDLFASMTIQKPYSAAKPLHTANVTRDEILAMQHQMKDHIKTLLEKEELVPQELVFVGRCLNLLRAVNKLYDAPINRINLFARRAVLALGPVERLCDVAPFIASSRSGGEDEWKRRRSLASSSWLSTFSAQSVRFELTLMFLSLTHTLVWYYNAFLRLVGLGNLTTATLEDVIEEQEERALTGVDASHKKSKKPNRVHGMLQIEAND